MNSGDRQAAALQVAQIIMRVPAARAAKDEFCRVMAWCLLEARAAYASTDSELPARPSETLREVQRFWHCAQKLEAIYRGMGPAGRRLFPGSCGSYPGWPSMHDPTDARDWQARIDEHLERFFAPFRQGLEVRRAAVPGPSIQVISAEDLKQRFDRDVIAFWAEAFEKILENKPAVSAGSAFLEAVADFLEAVETGRSANVYEKALDARAPGRLNLLGFFLAPPDEFPE